LRVLLIGGGGREHAIGLSVVKAGGEIFTISPNRNPGLDRIAKRTILGDENDRDFVLRGAMKVKPDLVLIGPESPLASGVSDILIKNKFDVFAPSSEAARLETSKSFCRNFMTENRLDGNIEAGSFTDSREAERFIRQIDHDFVIKPDGLTGGKGVMVQGVHFNSRDDGVKIVRNYLKSKRDRVLVERKVVGEEFSLQAFVKGKKIYFLPIVQDYKRAYEGDIGPNTGGMGSICFSEKGLPFIEEGTLLKAKSILRQLVSKFSEIYAEYVGPIYGGFISTHDGPKLLEINARLGDPEAINVLSLMENSEMEVAVSMLHSSNPNLEFRNRVNVLRYVVPRGYGSDPSPSEIRIDEEGIMLRGLKLYFASVSRSGNVLKQTRSRSLALLSEGTDLEKATKRFDNIDSLIIGDYSMRNDIGSQGTMRKKKNFMRMIRAGKV
jgi:phosphoribosylamine--glycine ligase